MYNMLLHIVLIKISFWKKNWRNWNFYTPLYVYLMKILWQAEFSLKNGQMNMTWIFVNENISRILTSKRFKNFKIMVILSANQFWYSIKIERMKERNEFFSKIDYVHNFSCDQYYISFIINRIASFLRPILNLRCMSLCILIVMDHMEHMINIF